MRTGKKNSTRNGTKNLELLDTHVLLWFIFGEKQLGSRARALIEQAWAYEVAVSATTFWEMAMLRDKRRLQQVGPIEPLRRSLIEEGLIEIPMDGQIGIRAAELSDFHGDPADRQIVSTAHWTDSPPPTDFHLTIIMLH